MINAGDESPGAHQRQQSLEFLPHGLLAARHGHLVKVADDLQFRIHLAEVHAIDSGLPLKRKNAMNIHFGKPGSWLCDVAIAVDDRNDVHLAHQGNDLAIVGRQKLIEQRFGEHWPVVVGEILGKGHKSGDTPATQRLQDTNRVVGQVLIHAMHQLGLIVKGIHVRHDAKQCARVPKVARKSDPEDDLASRLALGPGVHLGDQWFDGWIKKGAQGLIVILAFHPAQFTDPVLAALGFALGGWHVGSMDRKPELFVGIQAKVLVRIERVR